MTKEEEVAQAAAAAKVIADKEIADDKAKKDAEDAVAAEASVLEKLEAENAKLIEERDNYRNVALKRLGKLPADSEFLGEGGKEIDALIEDKVKEALINKEIDSKGKEREDLFRKALKENAELKLALKNRPGGSLGSEGGSSIEVKDNVFSPEQIADLKRKAIALKTDPEKFVERMKQNLNSRK